MADTVSSDSVAQDQLRAFVERIENIEVEIRDLNSGKSEVYAEAKGNGFDVKVLRKIIADRRKDYSARMEFETIYELYAAALGMHVEGFVRARVENTTQFDPETGEIQESELPETRHDGRGQSEGASGARPDEALHPIISSPPEVNAPVQSSAAEPECEDSLAPIQPETATQLAKSDESAPVEPCIDEHGDGDGLRLKGNGTANIDGAADIPCIGIRENGAFAAGVFTQCGDDAPPVHSKLADINADLTDKPEAGTQPASAPPSFLVSKTPMRPYCQHADDLSQCAGQGRHHCFACRKAMWLEGVEAA